ncbi:class A beta-lactamase-related serine hydrolase [Pedobacter psychrodurus]|uniref:Class A beta-lactamase-related serine hydrolase n=1 Tax=Pedobacter psychrodurus TaxID=2530456 RepID=A0A4V2MQB2_9SPHI|nr:serine hydrolase domain-containing protein [Pedobacter psychrodurus]TCD23361.1 class A beta-lactamase-related serine hydrolase [Pedobacter psychrodurus]
MKSILIAFLLLLSINLFSQEIDKDKIDHYITYIENNNGGIGSLSIYRNGKEVYTRNFGQEKLINTDYNKDTKYQIASVTKMVTAILILKLVEKGELKLDDKLSDFYPEIPNSKKIIIKNLLEHTSGLGNFAVRNGAIWVTEKVSEKEIFEEIRKQGVSFEPNEKVAYSNSAYILLRMIIEKKYKKEYHKVVIQEIVKPLNLKNFASIKSNPTNTFKSYKFAENWNAIKDIEYSNVIGVGDIASTTEDLNIVINSLFQYKILKKETLESMKPTIGKEDWGRGLALFAYGDNLFFGHSGDVLGSHSRLIYNPKDNISLSYSTNGERVPTNIFVENLVSIIYNKEFKLPEIK